MARAKRIIHNGNLNGPADYIPIVSGVQKHAYPGGVRIPWWIGTGENWRPLSAMTSESTPSPYVVTYSSRYSSSYSGYMAFNKTYSTEYGWLTSTSDSAPWITLKLDVPLKNITMKIYNRTRSSLVNGWNTFYVYGSDNGITWQLIGGPFNRSGVSSGAESMHSCSNYNDAYQYIRWEVTDWWGRLEVTNKYCAVGEIYVGGKYAS